MGREVRKVPASWQHPTKPDGRYIPLHCGSYAEAVAEWDEAAAMWAKGLRRNYGPEGGWESNATSESESYEEYAGARPVEEDYMPDWSEAERTHFVMYEDTSEGTPISPAFATPEELAQWLTDTNASAFGGMTASYDAWLRISNGGYAPSAVMENGVFKSGVEALKDSAA